MSRPVVLVLSALLLAILSTVAPGGKARLQEEVDTRVRKHNRDPHRIWQSKEKEPGDHLRLRRAGIESDPGQVGGSRLSLKPKQYLNELPCGTSRFPPHRLNGWASPNRNALSSRQFMRPLGRPRRRKTRSSPRGADENGANDYGNDYDYDFDFDFDASQLAPRQSRSLNGEKVYNNDYTFFMAMIRVAAPNSSETFCSGVLISDRHVLTAAQCLVVCNDNDQKILGVESVTASLGKSYERWDYALPTNFSSLVVHPKFNMCSGKPDYSYDIGVLTTSVPIRLGKQVNRICLPETLIRDRQTEARFYGYGLTSVANDGYTQWRRLNFVNFAIGATCDEHPLKSTTGPMLCAYRRAGFHPCQGDSGGPLVVWYNNVAYLIGLNSLTGVDFTKYTGCDPVEGFFPDDYYPSRYVSVKFLLDWIGQILEGAPDEDETTGEPRPNTTTSPQATTTTSTTSSPTPYDGEKRKSVKKG